MLKEFGCVSKFDTLDSVSTEEDQKQKEEKKKAFPPAVIVIIMKFYFHDKIKNLSWHCCSLHKTVTSVLAGSFKGHMLHNHFAFALMINVLSGFYYTKHL